MRRAISGYAKDEQGHFVAQLACGHTQHLRHQPPLISRPWVLSADGRASRLGTELDCPFCDLPRVPADVVPYRRTPSFSEATVPQGLLRDHRTKPGVWGRIVVEEGKLLYAIEQQTGLPPDVVPGSWHLRPGIIAAVVPTVLHRVAPLGAVRFYVEFLRDPTGMQDGESAPSGKERA